MDEALNEAGVLFTRAALVINIAKLHRGDKTPLLEQAADLVTLGARRLQETMEPTPVVERPSGVVVPVEEPPVELPAWVKGVFDDRA